MLIVELMDIFCQIPCFSVGASFLLQGFLKCLVLKFWRTRFAILRFTLWVNSLRWTLSYTWVIVNVDGELVSLQLLRLGRFGPSAASDSDRLIVQQSEIRSLKQVKS